MIQSSRKSHDGIDLSGINRIVAKVARLAGLKCSNPNRKNIHPHLLRHSFGRREDVDLASKQKIMGHSSFNITADLYGKVSTQEAKKRFMRTLGPLTSESSHSTDDNEHSQLITTKLNQLANKCRDLGISVRDYIELVKAGKL